MGFKEAWMKKKYKDVRPLTSQGRIMTEGGGPDMLSHVQAG